MEAKKAGKVLNKVVVVIIAQHITGRDMDALLLKKCESNAR